MRISERDLMTMASAYVEDGKLKKWRFYSDDLNHPDRVLYEKYISGTPITEDELNYILTFERVIIIGKFGVKFQNFSGTINKY